MKKLLLTLLFLLGMGVVVSGQTLTHPQKVYINPSGTGGSDSLKIDGGLRAGPDGTVQVINADGSISVSAALSDGSVQKIKLGNDCVSGEILIRNSSGSPSYWDCGTVTSLGGLKATDINVTITGTGWRFQNATVFGSSTTAQELVHVYNSAGDAGIQIQNNTQSWKLLSTGSVFRLQNGTNYPITASTTQLGIFNTSPTAGYEVDITGDVRISGDILNLGDFGNHLYPTTTDTLDIGTYNTKWRNLFVGSAIFDQFVQQNVQLYNGYQIIGKNSGSFNSAVSNVATTFFADESHDVGDYILVRGRDSGGVFQTEYFKILNKSGTGPYEYTITEGSGGRNLDGSGANSWNADTPYLVLGKQYDGRIELYAASGIPTIRVLSQGSAYNTFDSLVHLGGLDGITGVSSARYGLYLGKQDGTGDYLKFQNYLGSPTGDDGKLIIKGGIIAGSYLVSSSSVVVDSGGLDVGTAGRIRGGKSTFADTTAGFWLGYDSNSPAGYKLKIGNNSESLVWDGSDLTITGTVNANSGTFSGSITATGTISGGTISGATVTGGTINTASSGSRVEMSASTNSLKWYNGTTELGSISGSGIVLNLPTSIVQNRAYSFASSADTGLFAYNNTFYQYIYLYNKTNSATENGMEIITENSNRAINLKFFAGALTGYTTLTPGNYFDIDSGTLYVDATNNRVGIGTSSPVNALEVNNGDLAVHRSSGSANVFVGDRDFTLGKRLRIYYDFTSDFGGINSYDDAATAYKSLYIDGSTLVLNSVTGGNVGIATASPSYNLDVSGTGRVTGNFYATTITTTSGALTINPDSTSRVLFVDTDVEVAGLMLTNWTSGAGNRYVCTNATTNGDDSFIYYASTCGTSSIRYKQDVVPAELNWKAILDVQPVRFAYKSSPKIREFGVIAEQLAELGLTPLVNYNESGLVENVDYDKMVLYLIPIVKEQEKRIAELERRLQHLEKNK